MTESKAEFRCRIRRQQPEVDGVMICQRLLEHPWFHQAKNILGYSAIPPEIDLSPVLKAALFMGKNLLLPRCEMDGAMTARIVGDLSELQIGSYGILEPKPEAEIFPLEEINLILVPGLAFDEKGRRIGRGKGYYDRFLKGCRGKTIGICRCLVSEVPVEEHDKTMDAVLTEHKIIFSEMEDSPCLDVRKI